MDMVMKVIIHSMVPNHQPAVVVSLMEIACRKAASERRWYDPPWGIRDSAKDVHLTGQWSTGVVIF